MHRSRPRQGDISPGRDASTEGAAAPQPSGACPVHHEIRRPATATWWRGRDGGDTRADSGRPPRCCR